ncbi:MAG: KEOPS complex kinase/ATPase Bud32 [Candidatus Pacearchaeota archaeon]
MKIIGQGAEAIIYLDKKNNSVIKDRISKAYRIPELDKKIIKQRTKAEEKILEKTSKIISVPKPKNSKEFNKIIMPFINGKKLSSSLEDFSLKEQKSIMNIIGKDVAKMHENGIIHGDLTTSNMIYVQKEKKVYFIDFGLGFQNGKIEDKGIDVHLLKQALEAKHFSNWEILFKEFEKAYSSINPSESKKIFERLKAIEKRGRYRN